MNSAVFGAVFSFSCLLAFASAQASPNWASFGAGSSTGLTCLSGTEIAITGLSTANQSDPVVVAMTQAMAMGNNLPPVVNVSNCQSCQRTVSMVNMVSLGITQTQTMWACGNSSANTMGCTGLVEQAQASQGCAATEMTSVMTSSNLPGITGTAITIQAVCACCSNGCNGSPTDCGANLASTVYGATPASP